MFLASGKLIFLETCAALTANVFGIGKAQFFAHTCSRTYDPLHMVFGIGDVVINLLHVMYIFGFFCQQRIFIYHSCLNLNLIQNFSFFYALSCKSQFESVICINSTLNGHRFYVKPLTQLRVAASTLFSQNALHTGSTPSMLPMVNTRFSGNWTILPNR